MNWKHLIGRRAAGILLLTVLGISGRPRGAHAETVKPQPLQAVPLQQVQIDDPFWSPKLKVWREVTLADCFAKFEKDGAFANFDKIRDGNTNSEHGGAPWFDGLIYEMITASADFLAAQRDPQLEARLDGYIDRIAAAAAIDPDGYLNTYTEMKESTHRWGMNGGNDRWQHDLYNAGALVEAGVHYFRATGKTKLLQVACKLANHMADIMGPPPKKNVIPGHALGEISLVSLYQLFQEQPQLKAQISVPVDEHRYLALAEFWIEARGHHEGRTDFGAYDQDDIPVLQQKTIEGHAVRATLLCSGLITAGLADNRPDYLATSETLWDNMVTCRMYVTGGVGAVHDDEKFGDNYFLPNKGYLETCASVGAGFFHHNMNLAFGAGRYADELERVLYNGVLCGVSLKGDSYFYENPLEAEKSRVRWDWNSCPCCPPMFLKIMGALPGYIYAQDAAGIYVNLFIGDRAKLTVKGAPVTLQQTTRYPWDGAVKLAVTPEKPTTFAVNLRLPGWCAAPEIRVNGQPVQISRVNGYARIERSWQSGDVVELTLPMPVQRIHADPRVQADSGRVALQRGPIVYCLEGDDNGGSARNLVVPPDAPLTAEYRADLLGGVTVLHGPAHALHQADWQGSLYLPATKTPGTSNVVFTAIPYYANANRQPTEMRVWLAETPLAAKPLLPPSIASQAKPTASHCFASDTPAALNDELEPAASDDTKIPRFTWWDHRGTPEWVQYNFAQPQTVSAVAVYWWDERRINANCRVPQSWQLFYKDGESWKPVADASNYGTQMDEYNRVTFTPVKTTALRLAVQLQPDWSAGILEWRVE